MQDNKRKTAYVGPEKTQYFLSKEDEIRLIRGYPLSVEIVASAIHKTHEVIEQLYTFDIDIAALLGMRNLSAFVGEIFASSMIKSAGQIFLKNPHQDGYPDLLLMDEVGRRAWADLSSQLRDKKPFSPFPTLGIEIKATCGSVPTPAVCAKRGLSKPDIGDQRISLLTGYDWKAHHRETNYLMGIFWDFIKGKPKIIAVFYSGELETDDWGKIIQPKEGGGKTTSVSIMTRKGVQKMCGSWVAIMDDERYLRFFEKYNNISLF
jgi:hypothetical protein